MALRKLIFYGNPILRRKAKKIHRFDASLPQLVQDMFETMHAHDGVGLAAPQIGQSLRIFVAECTDREAGKHYKVAIACEICEVVKPLETIYHIRCLPRGQYQRFNGLHSEHKCWAPQKVRGFKLYELVKAKGEVGYIAGRRERGAFVIKDVTSGKKLAEVTPRTLGRVARPTQGWMMTRASGPG